MLAIARENHKSTKQGQLPFSKGDRILIIESNDISPGWLKGMTDISEGIFPEHLVDFVESEPTPTPSPKPVQKAQIVRRVDNLGISCQSYHASARDEISFAKDQPIFVETELDNGMSEGYVLDSENQRGRFPTECVQVIDDKPSPPSPIPAPRQPVIQPMNNIGGYNSPLSSPFHPTGYNNYPNNNNNNNNNNVVGNYGNNHPINNNTPSNFNNYLGEGVNNYNNYNNSNFNNNAMNSENLYRPATGTPLLQDDFRPEEITVLSLIDSDGAPKPPTSFFPDNDSPHYHQDVQQNVNHYNNFNFNNNQDNSRMQQAHNIAIDIPNSREYRENASSFVSMPLYPGSPPGETSTFHQHNNHHPNSNFVMSKPPVALPDGWTVAQTADGKFFYVDHVNKQTSWEPPSLSTTTTTHHNIDSNIMYSNNNSSKFHNGDHTAVPSIVQPEQLRSAPTRYIMQTNRKLRHGWVAMLDPTSGNEFFVDHNTKSTQWTYPYTD